MLVSSVVPLSAKPIPACLSCHTSHFEQNGSCAFCHQGNAGSIRKNIAHSGMIPGRYAWYALDGSQQVVRGNRLIERYACRRCHTFRGAGNSQAANLDRVYTQSIPGKVYTAVRYPAAQMPDFHFAENELTDLVNAILDAGRRTPAQTVQETPRVVHFTTPGAKSELLFEKKCGGCHRFLSVRSGGVGKGDTAPNLSGLFTEFYPKTFKNGEHWTEARLEQWLKNPRSIRDAARMRPVPLDTEEYRKIVYELK